MRYTREREREGGKEGGKEGGRECVCEREGERERDREILFALPTMPSLVILRSNVNCSG
jgi:hypothetical protein